MASSRNNTPLLLLLDGILSQDEQSTSIALEQIKKLDPSLASITFSGSVSDNDNDEQSSSSSSLSPLRSASVLEDIVGRLLGIQPQLARIPSENDGSLPLHFAASIGNIRVTALLLHHYRDAALMHNTKGKIPLHYAAQIVSDSTDDVSSWVPDILNLCLRGAVGNFSDVSTEECANYNIDDHANAIISSINSSNIFTINEGNGIINQPSTSAATSSSSAEQPGTITRIGRGVQVGIGGGYVMNGNFLNRSVIRVPPYPSSSVEILNGNNQSEVRHHHVFATIGAATVTIPGSPTGRFAADVTSRHRHNNKYGRNFHNSFCSPQRLPLNISLPRSKSPILEIDDCGSKKRSTSDSTNDNKRQRRGSVDEGEEDYKEDAATTTKKMCCYGGALEKHTFYQVHAALECSATTNILKCVFERYPEQHTVVDDYGQLPLHLAVSHYRSEGSVDLILEQIWKPNEDACYHRDYFGRLPIHLALMNNADSRFVKVLLDANPSSGVEQCQIVDERFAHDLPIHMATSHRCDLSTIFMLIRGDPTMVQSWKSC
ncbi:hypothetical protein FRACYDRAFT_235696 [Fragilariopsis cylindrus CCMP1102]|uniref:Ankyrin n=1 Tax=Fragilariopsis cylindrus CCMP1102 TaxID=635003 RepID=A0A1E7FN99_9STRA|nr:hypothetical protein FRACYDRAFT_235696 [Fragilariopsis cylindrus CCMP1102]|eukprot:OEU19638.1 hypothetical protein FRACYDRAFT_235696 [Fragilariopsis cylindrus CCMP1102]